MSDTWQEERAKFWEEYGDELYEDKNAPQEPVFVYTVYQIRPNDRVLMENPTSFMPFSLYVGVREDGLIEMQNSTYWFGKKWPDMSWDEKREVYDFLTEWEYAEWKQIGPEDSELFAMEKLVGKEEFEKIHSWWHRG